MPPSGALPAGQAAKRLGYHGRLDAPSRIYAGDSCGVSVELENRGASSAPVGLKATPLAAAPGAHVRLSIEVKDPARTELELELLCAGAVVAGATRQRQRVVEGCLRYHWSCLFPHAGDHSLDVVARAVGPEGERVLGVVRHPVRVVRIAAMGKLHVRVAARAAAVLSAGGAVTSFLNEVGVLEKLLSLL
jgi:hypothetical protein